MSVLSYRLSSIVPRLQVSPDSYPSRLLSSSDAIAGSVSENDRSWSRQGMWNNDAGQAVVLSQSSPLSTMSLLCHCCLILYYFGYLLFVLVCAGESTSAAASLTRGCLHVEMGLFAFPVDPIVSPRTASSAGDGDWGYPRGCCLMSSGNIDSRDASLTDSLRRSEAIAFLSHLSCPLAVHLVDGPLLR